MTQSEFDRLPLLLTRSQVVSAGVSAKAIRGLVAGGKLICVSLRKGGYRKYCKSSVAGLVGLKV